MRKGDGETVSANIASRAAAAAEMAKVGQEPQRYHPAPAGAGRPAGLAGFPLEGPLEVVHGAWCMVQGA